MELGDIGYAVLSSDMVTLEEVLIQLWIGWGRSES